MAVAGVVGRPPVQTLTAVPAERSVLSYGIEAPKTSIFFCLSQKGSKNPKENHSHVRCTPQTSTWSSPRSPRNLQQTSARDLLENSHANMTCSPASSQRPFTTRFTSNLPSGTFSTRGTSGIAGHFPHSLASSFAPSQNGRARRCSPVHALPAEEVASNSSKAAVAGNWTLETVLENVRTAVGLLEEWANPTEEHFVATGWQVLMGMPGQWTFMWSTDGRFWEQFWGIEMSYHSGFDGSATWQSDPGGRCFISDLDDREVSLLAGWIRSGVWLLPAARDWLEFRLADQSELDEHPDFALKDGQVALWLKLWDGMVEAYVVLEEDDWLPKRIVLKAYGGIELWLLRDWLRFFPERDWRYPASVTRVPKNEGVVESNISGVEVADEAALGAACKMPAGRMLKPPTAVYATGRYNSEVSSSLEVLQAESGHLLVRPLLDGRDVGYFILDSGASSLTLASRVAEQLGMAKFGEVHVTGMEGPMTCAYRRGSTFRLGPLEIDNPTYLELEPKGVVVGVEDIAGICGFDVFFHCVVEISRAGSTARVSLHDPLTYESPPSEGLQWQDVRMMGYVPHVTARIGLTNQTSPSAKGATPSPNGAQDEGVDVVMMVDTGAAGVEAILYARAVKELGLPKEFFTGFGMVKGMGTSSGMAVSLATLPSIQLGGQTFMNVKTLFLPETGAGGVDLSKWTAGFVCGDLLSKCDAIYDYSRNRMVLIRADKPLSKL